MSIDIEIWQDEDYPNPLDDWMECEFYQSGEPHYQNWVSREELESIFEDNESHAIKCQYSVSRGYTFLRTAHPDTRWNALLLIYEDVVNYEERAKQIVEVYSSWANGYVHGYTVTADGEHVDSCGGFFSYDDCHKEAGESASEWVSIGAWLRNGGVEMIANHTAQALMYAQGEGFDFHKTIGYLADICILKTTKRVSRDAMIEAITPRLGNELLNRVMRR